MKPEDFTPEIVRAIRFGLACHRARLLTTQARLLCSNGNVNTGAVKIIGKSLRENEQALELFETKETKNEMD